MVFMAIEDILAMETHEREGDLTVPMHVKGVTGAHHRLITVEDDIHDQRIEGNHILGMKDHDPEIGDVLVLDHGVKDDHDPDQGVRESHVPIPGVE